MLLDTRTDCLKHLWVSNVILLSEVSSGCGRITVRSPLTSSFCQLGKPMVMHRCQEFCPVLIILAGRKRREVEMPDSKCRWRNAARNEGNTGVRNKGGSKEKHALSDRGAEINGLRVGKGMFLSKCEVCTKI